MTRKKTETKPSKTNAESVAHDLMQFDSNEMPGIKDSLKERKVMRDTLKELLEEKAELPANSTFFAALKITEGKIRHKEAAEELSKRLKLTPQEYELFLEDYRTPGSRLKYGTITSETRFYQEDFDFITPKSVVITD